MNDYLLHYSSPANEWVEALPLGNGHMGAMAYGGESGLYELTESSCWSGCTQDECLRPNAREAMADARRYLLKGDIAAAEKLLAQCTGVKENYGTQLPMGRLMLSVSQMGEAVSQTRSLDIMSGVERETLEYPSAKVTREGFISNPDKVMAVRVMSDKPVAGITISLEGVSGPWKCSRSGCDITAEGIALENIHSDGLHGVNYIMRLRFDTDGKVSRSRAGTLVEGASYVTVYLSCACDLWGADAKAISHARLGDACERGYDALFARHTADMSEHMSRCTLSLAGNINSALDTDRRILAYREDKSDYALTALYFAYGRYLSLISSREDSPLPSALQGILNDGRACRMEWTDDMHLDINTQMNYYPSEPTGIGDSVAPLFTWMKNILMPQGEKMARELYGADGWCAHTVSNAHGWAAPGWDVDWGLFLSGGAWAATHIWEHWLYTGDIDFLREYIPVLRGCARFYLSVLSENESGELVINPSYSPENQYKKDGRSCCMTVGATADTSLAKYIFKATAEADAILGESGELDERIEAAYARLPEFKTGSLGRLCEWKGDFEDSFPDHRHMCHLIALHPLGLIDAKRSPELAAAVKRVMECRLGENARDIVLANWAGAMLIIMNARLYDGESAGRFVEPMISFLSRPNMLITHEGPTDSVTGGIYELDGNTGLCAAICEMLIQSRRERVDILPAIPCAWESGKVSGLRIYGGHSCDIEWNADEITLTVTPANDAETVFSHGSKEITLTLKKGVPQTEIFTR
ncbi:MAG: glycoside hydrolase family 95 protein [Eubacteriales bacterium]